MRPRLSRVGGALAVLLLVVATVGPVPPDALAQATTSPATQPAMPKGRTIPLTVGELFVPETFEPASGAVDVLVHFHGYHPTVAREFVAAGVDGVLITVNYQGLSSVYSRPFSDPGLFARLLDDALDRMKRERIVSAPAQWGLVRVSSFSAGFGAVREILKEPRSFDRIDGLLMADSIYAGYVGEGANRAVDPANMEGFRRFARAAVEGRKAFIVTHCDLVPGTYASTRETADDLLKHVGVSRKETREPVAEPIRVTSRAALGSFEVHGCTGADSQAHMQHLQHLGMWVSRLTRLSPVRAPRPLLTQAAPVPASQPSHPRP